jgi:hypothetical protein
MSVWFITFHGGSYPCKTPSSPAPSYTGNIRGLSRYFHSEYQCYDSRTGID